MNKSKNIAKPGGPDLDATVGRIVGNPPNFACFFYLV